MDACQSCGMPMKLCPEGGGTNGDGSRSKEYCSYCWKDGSFTDDFTDVKEYRRYLYKMMRTEQKLSPLKAWFYTLPALGVKRWKNR